MKNRFIISALFLCASSAAFANTNPITKGSANESTPQEVQLHQRPTSIEKAGTMNKNRRLVVKDVVAQEYIELGKVQELNRHLASDIIDVNIAMANKCGEVMHWKELVEESVFRSYTSSRAHVQEYRQANGHENYQKHEDGKQLQSNQRRNNVPSTAHIESLSSVATALCRVLQPYTMLDLELKN